MGTPDRRELGEALRRLDSSADPLDAVDAARRLREMAERTEHELVRAARGQGVSWSRIGALYDLTKQGAQQRFQPKKAKRARDD